TFIMSLVSSSPLRVVFTNDPSTTETSTLSLHDALPISARVANREELTKIIDELLSTDTADAWFDALTAARVPCGPLNDIADAVADRKSTRLNSSHVKISYAVFCLKKKKTQCERADTAI